MITKEITSNYSLKDKKGKGKKVGAGKTVFNVDAPEDLSEAIAQYTEQTVFDVFMAQFVIYWQGVGRNKSYGFDDNGYPVEYDKDDVLEAISKVKFGTTNRVRKSDEDKVADLIPDPGTPEFEAFMKRVEQKKLAKLEAAQNGEGEAEEEDETDDTGDDEEEGEDE